MYIAKVYIKRVKMIKLTQVKKRGINNLITKKFDNAENMKKRQEIDR